LKEKALSRAGLRDLMAYVFAGVA